MQHTYFRLSGEIKRLLAEISPTAMQKVHSKERARLGDTHRGRAQGDGLAKVGAGGWEARRWVNADRHRMVPNVQEKFPRFLLTPYPIVTNILF